MSSPTVDLDRLNGRNAGIDLVRGVSIILVVIHHVSLRIPLPKTNLARVLPRRLLEGLGSDGYEAVFVFFVVSGFLIAGNTIRRWGALPRLPLRAFYARRAARIAPCLVVLVAVLALLDALKVPDYTIARPDQSLPRAVLSALALHLNWYEGRTGYLPGGWDVLWSLSIEEAFYLGFPLVCLALGGRRVVLAAVFAALSLSLPLALDTLAHAPEIWREKAYLPGLAAIATGVCAALLVSWVPRPTKPALVAAIGWSGLVLLAALFWRENALFAALGNVAMLVLTVSAASLMAAFHWGWGSERAGRGTAWLRSFGVMSYEIYLTHMFVVFALVGLFRCSGGRLDVGWLWCVAALGLSWGLGRLVARHLSLPAERWMRRTLGTAPASPRSGSVPV